MNGEQSPNVLVPSQQRVVRVFISSTFQDMFEEREQLVKFTFPELRKRCRERQVEFVEVDLRWGITDEQKAEGKVLPICLAEIERCRPYFIGLLGERYGWVPGKIDDELAEIQSWLKEHKEKSVTELEIIHGVLRNPEMKPLAYFYFRNPETSQQIGAQMSLKPGYQPEPEPSREKLKTLKKRIRKSGYAVHEDYANDEALGKLVLEDLWKAIDERYPLSEVPTPLERERMEHEAFAAARRKVYIGREDYFKRLDEHVEGDGSPLVLLGESGSGKSALISNWAKQYRENHPEDFMLVHFIGSTPDSADYVRILRRIMEEIQERYEPKEKKEILAITREGEGRLSEEIPIDPKKVIEAFPIWLAKAAAKGRFILILDALNQLEDRDNAPDLGWLPQYFPPNIRVILSTLPGRSLEAIQKRNWKTYTVNPIDRDERKRYINEYLEQYRRKLSDERVNRIASAEQSANPLYLRTLLEELRVFGIQEELNDRITHYLTATTVDDLFELVLGRLEEDYEKERKHLVRDAMSLLWASRRGLTEAELMELLGSDGEPLQRAYWSPLFLAAEESFVIRSGLLNFFHDFLRKAVEDRYLYNSELKRKTHLLLADYFDKREIDDRKVDELPWQLQQAENWERLKDCITNVEMFLKLNTETKKYELMAYWLSIGDRYDMVQSYNTMLDNYEAISPSRHELAYVLNDIAFFLYINARYKGAEALLHRALAIREKVLGREHPHIATSLNNLASLYHAQGRYAEAEPLFQRSIKISEKVLGREHRDVATSLNGLAQLYHAQGRYAEAEPLFQRSIKISEKVLGGEHPDIATSLNNMALLYHAQGRYSEAEPLYQRSINISEKGLGREHPHIATSLNNLAELYRVLSRYAEAEPLYKSSLEIREKVLGKQHPEVGKSLNNIALLYYAQGRYAEAELYYRRSLEIWEKVLGRNHPEVARTLSNLGALYYVQGRYTEAEPPYQRSLAIYEIDPEKNYSNAIQVSFCLAQLLREKGDQKEAAKFYKLLLKICEGNINLRRQIYSSEISLFLNLMAISHNNLAHDTYVLEKYWNKAEYHYRESIDLFKKIQDFVETANVELNLQIMYYLSGQTVNIDKIKEVTQVLANAGDKRAEKGFNLIDKL